MNVCFHSDDNDDVSTVCWLESLFQFWNFQLVCVKCVKTWTSSFICLFLGFSRVWFCFEGKNLLHVLDSVSALCFSFIFFLSGQPCLTDFIMQWFWMMSGYFKLRPRHHFSLWAEWNFIVSDPLSNEMMASSSPHLINQWCDQILCVKMKEYKWESPKDCCFRPVICSRGWL